MKKLLITLTVLCLVFSMTACSGGSGSDAADSVKQTAEAYLDQDSDAVITVKADLSGGWSIEYARGAAYIYDSEITEGKSCTGMLITLDKVTYEDWLKTADADENKREADNGIYFTSYEEGDEEGYLTSLDDKAYVLITANKDLIESVVARFELSLE